MQHYTSLPWRMAKKLAVFGAWLAFVAGLSTIPARAGITYSCAANVDTAQAGTCAYLNSTVAGLYASAFSNANANIYIQMGSTGLGESTTGFYNTLSYSTYLTDLTTNSVASGDPIQVAAVSALNTYDTTAYGTDSVVITSALGEALGVQDADLVGTTAGGSPCTIGTGGCYNGIITVTSNTSILYWNQEVGSQTSSEYDFYSVVEHETDEVLGTASCMSTTSGTGLLTDPCDGDTGDTGTPSAVDLFRYNSSGHLALNGSYIGLSSAPAGAYFSYNGGSTNGVPGGPVYNTVANGNDYADYVAGPCPGGPYYVQDGTGCPGSHPMINTDGGGEINILNAVGFEDATPEPGAMVLMGGGFAILLGVREYRRRKRAA
jgi:PEP-CTERM motif